MATTSLAVSSRSMAAYISAEVCASNSSEESLETVANHLELKEFVISQGMPRLLAVAVPDADQHHFVSPPQTLPLSFRAMCTGSLSSPLRWWMQWLPDTLQL